MKILEDEGFEEIKDQLDWNECDLEESREMLRDWDTRGYSYYNPLGKLTEEVDKKNREILRRCIAYWEKKHENRQT